MPVPRDRAPMVAAPAWSFFNPMEAAFVAAAVARLIPADEFGAGADESGVAMYVDRVLARAAEAGAPPRWRRGRVSAPAPPALVRAALRAVDADVRMRHGMGFEALPGDVQDIELAGLESSTADLDGVAARVIFETLLLLAVEGYRMGPLPHAGHDSRD